MSAPFITAPTHPSNQLQRNSITSRAEGRCGAPPPLCPPAALPLPLLPLLPLPPLVAVMTVVARERRAWWSSCVASRRLMASALTAGSARRPTSGMRVTRAT